jgi:phenylacetate-CoA ligase
MSHRLRDLLQAILPDNRFYAAKFAGIDPATAELCRLPLTTKAELLQDQERHPPYGTVLTYPLTRYNRMHQTSGTTTGRPLRWLDTPESWDWVLHCKDQIFRLIGMRKDDRLFFPFSFGPFLGFWAAFAAASRAGHLVLPGGGLSSVARLRFMLDHSATVVFCTPSYALHLAEVAAKEGVDLAKSPVRMLVVAGEPGGSIPATRQRIESAWGARVFDHSGMTEIGPLAVECVAQPGGLHVLEDDYIAEMIDPSSAQPVPPGQVGELVLTSLGRIGSPLIRYRTGDLVRLDVKPCPCGCRYVRLDGGILGRVDDMIHLRGNNIYPSAIEAVIRRFAEILEFRLEIDRRMVVTSLRIDIECTPDADGGKVVERLGRALRDELMFRPEIIALPPGALPRFEMKAKRIYHKDTKTQG